MTQLIIDTGSAPNDGTGDPLRTAFTKTNYDFSAIYAAGPVDSNIRITNNTILTINTNGNLVLAPNGVGVVQSNVNIVPNQANVRNLGSSTQRWSTVYTQYLNVTNGTTVDGDLTVGGNLTVTGNTVQIGNLVTDAKTLQLANTANTANAATGSGITVGASDNIATLLYNSTGNVWTTNIGVSAVGNVTAPYFIGNGSTLTSIAGANVSGTVANATYATTAGSATTAGTVTTAAQGNITSVGVLTSLSATGNVTAGNVLTSAEVIASGVIQTGTGFSTGGYLSVNGSTDLHDTNIIGNLSVNTIRSDDSTIVLIQDGVEIDGDAVVNGNVTGAYILGNGSQLTGLPAIYGNANVTALLSNLGSNVISGTGNITTTANVSGAYVKGNGSALTNLPAPVVTQDIASTGAMSIMLYDGNIKYNNYATVEPSSGNIAGGNISTTGKVTAGNVSTGVITLTNGAVIRDNAGDSVAFGQNAGATGQGEVAVAIGYYAGNTAQGNAAVAVGAGAGTNTQGVHAVAVGTDSGATTQGNRAVAIGYLAGSNAQGTAAVAIGYYAGELNQGNNSIIINATDTSLQQTTANTFTVAPVRNDVANIGNVMFYNTTSKEITYGNVISVAGNVTGGNLTTAGIANVATLAVTGSVTVQGSISISSSSTSLSATGNVIGGNLLTGGLISATGNVSGGNLNVTGNIVDTGALSIITGSNGNIALAPNGTGIVTVSSNLSVTGNITANNLSLAGNITSSIGFTGATITINNAPGGNEGAEVIWALPSPANTVLTTSLVQDVFQNGMRFFESGGSSRGLYMDLGNVPNGSGTAVGYRDIPQVSFAANATIAATDAGRHYYSTSASNLTLTIANNTSVSWAVGTAITVVNRGSGNITVAQGSGVSLYLAGNSSAANRTVSTYGMATLINLEANVWMINGTGLT